MRLLGKLWVQVLIATVAGIALGLLDPVLGTQMKPLGDVFIALIRMMIAPVIFCTVVHGIGGMRDLKRAGRVALKALIYFEAITTLALIFALVAVNLWKPGAGMNIDPRTLNANLVHGLAAQAHAQSVAQYILNIIPATFVGAFTAPNVLQVLLVSILFGVALSATGERGRPVFDFIGAASQVIFRIVGFIMWIAPIGAFGAIAFMTGAFGTGALISLGGLLAEFYIVSALFVVIVFGAILRALGLSLAKLMRHIGDELLVVAATTSSETVLPRLIQKLEALGCEESVVGLVIPAGYSFNLDGTCLYLVTAAVFLAQATNTPLPLAQQLGLILVLLLTSKGAAGVAGAALVVLAATLSSTAAIPVASIALILGVHRLMAEALTFVNVIGNCVATIVVAKWEGAVDRQLLATQIGVTSSRI
ncbi:MAG TPA: C4-dicarboxylate transporter DctA [Rhizomicrobium sp.]|jgi:aerobic C4-dicarboxylate transport protein